MRKCDELEQQDSTFNKAAAEEPLFILRAQDMFAPSFVRIWAMAAEAAKVSPAKVAEARAIADLMEKWPTRKIPT